MDETALGNAAWLAQKIDVSRNTVYQWRYKDQWPFPRRAVVRVNKLLRFSKQQIEEWIAAGCPSPGNKNEK